MDILKPLNKDSYDFRKIEDNLRSAKEILNENDFSGYILELCSIVALEVLGVKHHSNPINPIEWEAMKGEGADHLVTDKVVLEDKHKSFPYHVTPSMFFSDYLPRFLAADPKHSKQWVLVTTDMKFSKEVMELLALHNILVINIPYKLNRSSFIYVLKYLIKMFRILFNMLRVPMRLERLFNSISENNGDSPRNVENSMQNESDPHSLNSVFRVIRGAFRFYFSPVTL